MIQLIEQLLDNKIKDLVYFNGSFVIMKPCRRILTVASQIQVYRMLTTNKEATNVQIYQPFFTTNNAILQR